MSAQLAHSQSEGQRAAFGINAGATKYWGEFTDNQFWLGGDAFFRYNIIPQLSLQATFGLGQIRWKTDKSKLGHYSGYFGEGAQEGDPYLKENGDPLLDGGSEVNITDKNSNRILTYELYLTYNLFATQSFVPYIFAGIGYMNHEPAGGDTGYEGPLPNNAAGIYEKNNIVIPFGLGFEKYITDNLVFNGRATLRLTNTDYLDDLSSEGGGRTDPNADAADDLYMTFGVGLSYYILGVTDFDKDGLSNSQEEAIGTDPNNPDTDGDGLTDGEEVETYKTDPLKQDTDGDGLTDYDEVMKYKTSPIQADSDSDGLNDGAEIARKTDPNNPDTDSDGLIDGDEVNKYETDPLNPDTDGDTLLDGDEVLKYGTDPKAQDSDKDGLKDGDEINIHKTNPADADTDQDGLKDGLEINQYKTDPNNPDTDGDGLMDGKEVNDYGSDPKKADTDGDGLSDGDEVNKYKTNPVSDDSDRDGLSDGDEVNIYKTDPANPDTDGDGLTDGDEVNRYKTNPNEADTDRDGLNDGEEVNKYKTDPLVVDTDSDGLSDGVEVNKTNTDPTNPDTDGDKILDGEDDCPLIAGKPSDIEGEHGCPQAPKVGTKTDFPDILFIVDSDEFNYEFPETARNLAKLLEYVNQCEGLQVMIEGHASQEGDDSYNQKLSERRAKKVRDWLIEQGVSADKIAGFIGYGERQPKVPEPTGAALKKISKTELEAIRKQNRRITVEVTRTCQEGKDRKK